MEDNNLESMVDKIPDESVYEISSHYIRALLTMGTLVKLVDESEKVGWDQFDACIYCKRHRSKEHLENCILIIVKREIQHFLKPTNREIKF